MSNFFYYVGIAIGLLGVFYGLMGFFHAIKGKGSESSIREAAIMLSTGGVLYFFVSEIIISLSK